MKESIAIALAEFRGTDSVRWTLAKWIGYEDELVRANPPRHWSRKFV